MNEKYQPDGNLNTQLNILAIDSSDQILSVALAAGNGIWHSEIDAGHRHSEFLMECVNWLCCSAGFKALDLNMVACMKGPGSFTGLRIGFSAAKGLAMALGIPLIAVPTLDCLAYPLSHWPGIVLPVIDAKKGCFFCSFYRGGKRISDDMDASAETIIKEIIKSRLSDEEPVILTGQGAELLFSELSKQLKPESILIDFSFRRGRAQELLKMIKYGIIDSEDCTNSAPVYLRKSDAELSRNRKQADQI